MRLSVAFFRQILFVSAGVLLLCFGNWAWASEQELLQRFQQQNQAAGEKLKQEVEAALAEAEELAATDRLKAVRVLQQALDRVMAGRLRGGLDRELVEQLRNQIDDHTVAVRESRLERLVQSYSAYRYYLQQVAVTLRSLNVQLPEGLTAADIGVPALFTYADGMQQLGLLFGQPAGLVCGSLHGKTACHGPQVIPGVQIEQGFYIFDRRLGRYVFQSNELFFQTATLTSEQVQNPHFWRKPIPAGTSEEDFLTKQTVKREAPPGLVGLFNYWAQQADPLKGFVEFDPVTLRAPRNAILRQEINGRFKETTLGDRERLYQILVSYVDALLPNLPIPESDQDAVYAAMMEIAPIHREEIEAMIALANRLSRESHARR